MEEAVEKVRQSPAWKVPLFSVEGSPAEPLPQEVAVQPAQPLEPAREAPEEAPPPGEEDHPAVAQQEAPAAPVSPQGAKWPLLLLVGLTVFGLALWLVHSTLAPPPETPLPGSGPEKGSPPVSTTSRSTPSSFLATWLCAVVGIGCPAAQVKPPEPEECPKEATEAMFQELKIRTGSPLQVVVDINQPGDMSEEGVYQDGPVIGRLTVGDGSLPKGTLLHGHLWTGPHIYDLETNVEREAVLGRFTLAVLPDGRKYPVCIVLGGQDGRVPKGAGSKPGAVRLPRELPVSPRWRWP
jgi:serine/threonine-protein kinase